MAIKGSFYKSKGPDIAGAFREGQETAREALEQDEDKESTQKPQVEVKDAENGGNGGNGGGGGRGLFARKEGGTRMGNLLRSIGSVFTKSKG